MRSYIFTDYERELLARFLENDKDVLGNISLHGVLTRIKYAKRLEDDISLFFKVKEKLREKAERRWRIVERARKIREKRLRLKILRLLEKRGCKPDSELYLTTTQIVNYVRAKPSDIYRCLRKLFEEGLVEKLATKTRGRELGWRLTEKGLKQIGKTEKNGWLPLSEKSPFPRGRPAPRV